MMISSLGVDAAVVMSEKCFLYENPGAWAAKLTTSQC